MQKSGKKAVGKYAKDLPYAVEHELVKVTQKGKAEYLCSDGQAYFGEQAALGQYSKCELAIRTLTLPLLACQYANLETSLGSRTETHSLVVGR